MPLLKKALQLITGDTKKTKRPLKTLTERDLIELESEIGRDLFGPIPKGHRREFFCLDEHTWVWYEEWIDAETGKMKALTTRYEVHENGILKVQDGTTYRFIDGEELRDLGVSVRMYYERVMRGIYKKDPHTGKPLIDPTLAPAPNICR